MAATIDRFGSRATLASAAGSVSYYRLEAVAHRGVADLDTLPATVKILLENVLRQADGGLATEADVLALAGWSPQAPGATEQPFLPARVVLQDFTGVPAV